MGIKNVIKKIIRYVIMVGKEEKLVPVPKLVNSEKLLDGKIALITGGSSGIGLAIAEEFARVGAKVVLVGTNEEKLKSAVTKIGGGYSVFSV